MIIKKLIRSDLQDFNPYSSARDEAKTGRIFLNANESPYPNYIEETILLNRYPEKQPSILIEKLSQIYGVRKEKMLISRGSDEGIDLLIRLFCQNGKDGILVCPPTFGMYYTCAKLQGAFVKQVPLLKEKGYQLDIKNIVASMEDKIKIIFLCSPNNPTGNCLDEKDIVFLCEAFEGKALIVLDEAYVEFSENQDLIPLLEKYENFVILRTLSKAYGLAGARCGVLLGDPDLIQWVLKIIPPYPIPATGISFMVNILEERYTKIQKQIEEIQKERNRMLLALKKIPAVKQVWDSEANFLLLEVKDAKKIMTIACEQGIVLRDMSQKPNLENCIRISIGLPVENNQVIALLQSLE